MIDINNLSDDWIKEKVCSTASLSMRYELFATPKPGLVDGDNSGAHDDMTFEMFMASISSISYYFPEVVDVALNYDDELENALKYLKPIGLKMEEAMFSSTQNINTHRGMIFLLGVLIFIISYMLKNRLVGKKIYDTVKELSRKVGSGVNKPFFSSSNSTTHGQKVYEKYRVKGMRGEIEEGIPTVMDYGLPYLENITLTKENHSKVFINTLLSLMVHVDDTTILWRHDLDVLSWTKSYAYNCYYLGGCFTERGMNFIRKFDDDCKMKKVSPGGSADLLAATIFIYHWKCILQNEPILK